MAATRADWQQRPDMVDVERDEDVQNGSITSKTVQVMMIDGSPYDRLIARNGKTLAANEEAQQTQQLQAECAKRANQSPEERAKRLAKYHRNQERMFDLLRDMTHAFDFNLSGEDQVKGHGVYVLCATPRPGYQPANREAKMLTAMQGRLWIDRESYRWVRVQAEVTKPVWFGLFIAKVYPGTQFLLEQEPVEKGVWLPKHFRVQVKSTLLLVHKNFIHDETYKNYRLARSPTARAGALAEKGNANCAATSNRPSSAPRP